MLWSALMMASSISKQDSARPALGEVLGMGGKRSFKMGNFSFALGPVLSPVIIGAVGKTVTYVSAPSAGDHPRSEASARALPKCEVDRDPHARIASS